MFSLLYEDKFYIGGVKIDINPITERYAGGISARRGEVFGGKTADGVGERKT